MPFWPRITKRKEAFASVAWGGYVRGWRQRVPERAGWREKIEGESDIITIIFKNRKKAERILGEMLAESSYTKTCAT